MQKDPLAGLVVQVERGRSGLRVTARTPDVPRAWLVEASFSGGPEGVSLRVHQGNLVQAFSRDALARHPALSAVLRLIADEVDFDKAESAALLPYLFRSLLVYVARSTTAVPRPHWGRELRDLQIERALALLNQDIAKRWTVELLARAVGLSRPVFAQRFVRVLGLSPMRYLTQRRMQIAAALLLGSDAALAEVASRVGYLSEFAFNRAFKRHYQVPPGVYRQRPPAALATTCRLAA